MKTSIKRLAAKLAVAASLLLCFIIISIRFAKNTQPHTDNLLTVHFLDVGQGSSALIELNGRYMLFDGGDGDYSSFVVSYLKSRGVAALDYVIASHYDADHLNGIVGALNVYDAGMILAPDYIAESRVYKSFMSIIKEKNYRLVHPKTGDTYNFSDSKFTIISPVRRSHDNVNNNSVGIKLTYGSTSFIIMGDAEKESEKDSVEAGLNMKADVYAVNHHGSGNSSSDILLDAISPKYAVISCGKDNSYGHPAETVLTGLQKHNVAIYRTDLQGTIIVKSDGVNISFSTKSANDDNTSDTDITDIIYDSYIGNIKSKKFHLPTCKGLPDRKNRISFSDRTAAVEAGYEPCGICRP